MGRVLLGVAAGVAVLLILPVVVLAASAAQPGADGTPTDAAISEIPAPLLAAYQQAPASRCPTLPWSVLAGIGKVETSHATTGGAQLAADGTVTPPIIGPRLTGSNGTARVVDTDDGRLDGDPVLDRAVGPMQFIPGTWAPYGVDGSGDGRADPHNAFDAIHAAAVYLCYHGGDDPSRLRAAVWAYNHSWDYVDQVLAHAARYSAPAFTGGAAPADLIAAVLANPRLTIYSAGRDDIAAGRIDARILTLLQTLSQRYTLAVSSLQTGHSKCIGGGNYAGCSVSNHWYGRGVDIYRVNGRLVTASNPDAYAIAIWLASLTGPSRPDEVGSPWSSLEPLPGHFHDAAHRGHLHIGWESKGHKLHEMN